jgi:hypothetical protein
MRTGKAAALGLAAAAAAAAVAVGAFAPPARASDAKEKEQCIAAADQAQQLRDASKYQLAREAFSRCARETCPTMVRQDCTQWLQELDERVPTVVFGAQDEKGHDLVEVSVSIDGVPVASAVDGKPLPVDPGDHALRFEAKGFQPVEGHVVVLSGEKNRVLNVQLTGRSGTRVATAAPPPRAPEAPSHGRARPLPIFTWVFGGIAVAAFASEAYFGIAGLNQRNADLAPGGCAPRCSTSEKAAIQSEFAIADVSLGVGLMSAGLAAYFFFSSRGTDPPPAAAVRLAPAPLPGGGALSVSGRF